MAYRSDVDALEARLVALRGEVGEKTRERDEVAHLLTEARARAAADGLAADWAAGGPQRRRKRRIWAATIAATIAVLGTLLTLRVMHHGHPDPFQSTARQFAIFTHAMCTCHDKQCADGVNDELTRWAQDMARDARQPQSRPSPEQMKLFQDLGQRYATCMTTAMTPPAP
jgi:hypothetical protein